MLHSPLGRLRLIGFVEGCSFLLLLVAMVPKYFASQPEGVKILGPIHGGLWILMLGIVAEVAWRRAWPKGRVMAAVLASVLPGGPFVFDRSLKREQDASR